MTKKQCWRYRCDFCGKRGLSGGHMKSHEKHCTANPARICRMHAHYEKPQVPIADLMRCLSSKLPDYGMAALRESTENCPMCILSAIRQSGIAKFDLESPPPDLNFNFKEEVSAAWAIIDNANQEW